ncbi:hypothetical protein D9M68_599790 [compost metagenome]
MIRLNGWQRLWVLFTVLAGAFAVFILVLSYPDSEYAEAKFKESMAAIENSDEVEGPWKKYQQSSSDVPKSLFGDLLIQQESDAVKPRFSGTPISQPSVAQRKQEAQQQYEADLQLLSRDRRSMLVQVGSVWLLSSVGLYVLGWLIAWVIRGFRKP